MSRLPEHLRPRVGSTGRLSLSTRMVVPRGSGMARGSGMPWKPASPGRSRRAGAWPLTAFLVAILSFGACSSKKDEDTIEESLIQEVTRGDLVEEIIESGRVTPVYEVDIKTRVSGEVTCVEVEEGQEVTKGQVLMKLDPTPYLQKVSLARIDYQEAELKVENAQVELERSQAAFDARGISRYELDRAKHALELAKLTRQRAYVQLQTAKDQVGYCTITSPIDGTVIRRTVDPGEVVTAGVTSMVNGEAQLTIAKLDTLLLVLNLNQVDVGRVREGQRATVTLDAFREQPVEATVKSIAASAHLDKARGIDVFKVEVEIDPSSTSLAIKPGMTAEVRIHVGEYPQVVKVPLETVFEEKGKYYIYVVRDDPEHEGKKIKEKVEVTVGHKGLEEVEIARGLKEGERIYLKGDTKDVELKL